MSRVLIVEDEEPKRRALEEYLAVQVPDVKVTIARSVRSALSRAKEGEWAAIILDMTLPTFDLSGDELGGRPRTFGGRELLRQFRRKEVTVPVIVFTQFDEFREEGARFSLAELDAELRAEFVDQYKGAVYYHASRTSWKKELMKLLSPLLSSP